MAEDMRCENCGAQIEDEVLTVYCKKCGHKLSGGQQEAGTREQAAEQQAQGKKKRRGLVKGCIAALGGVLLVGVVVLLVWMQGPEAFRSLKSGADRSRNQAEVAEEIYGEWSDKDGILSLTFQKDGSVRVGAGSGFLGAELFTFTKGDGNTLYLKANADGVLGAVSLQMKYELQGDTLAVSVFGVDYLLERK